MCFFSVSRYNSSAITLKFWPSPWRSPTVTDRRRSESAWRERRSRLIASFSLTRHSHHCGNRTPFPSVREDTSSGTDRGPLFHRLHTHLQTLRHAHLANQLMYVLSIGMGPGAPVSVTGDWLTWLSQWGAIVSYGNVLQSWTQEPRWVTRTHTHSAIMQLIYVSWQIIQYKHSHTHSCTHIVFWMYLPWENAISVLFY